MMFSCFRDNQARKYEGLLFPDTFATNRTTASETSSWNHITFGFWINEPTIQQAVFSAEAISGHARFLVRTGEALINCKKNAQQFHCFKQPTLNATTSLYIYMHIYIYDIYTCIFWCWLGPIFT